MGDNLLCMLTFFAVAPVLIVDFTLAYFGFCTVRLFKNYKPNDGLTQSRGFIKKLTFLSPILFSRLERLDLYYFCAISRIIYFPIS